MLLGQDLRRRHEGGLRAGFHRQQHRRDRDHRFPGADVALQQTIHRVRRGKVAPDLRNHARLRPCQVER